MKRQAFQEQHGTARRVYTLCTFDRGLVVPKVQFIEATTDDEAVASARGSNVCSVREVWDGHRLVAEIQPMSLQTADPEGAFWRTGG